MLLKLDIAIADYPHTHAIKDGRIPIAGVDPNFITITPQVAAYRKMVREVAFDVCELAPTTYLIARGLGAPFIALPIFVTRHFHHGGLLVRPEAGIHSPKDLEGKRVGVRAWSVTTGVWTRAILEEEYGVDNSKIIWVVDDEEHVEALVLPPNVERAPPGQSLFSMMQAGTLDAGFSANAGIGRSGDPASGWRTEDTAAFPDLFANPPALEAAWFRRTRIYPMHAAIVVKDAVLAEHPWVARSLADAFATAKDQWLATLPAATGAAAAKYRALTKIVGPDPLPYGVLRNMPTIDALQRAAYSQKLIAHKLSLDESFSDPAAAPAWS
jgi:4,5-dihydroxyphthalate decarboxylase